MTFLKLNLAKSHAMTRHLYIYCLIFIVSLSLLAQSTQNNTNIQYFYDTNNTWDDLKAFPQWIWNTEKSYFKSEHLPYWGITAGSIAIAYLVDDEIDAHLRKKKPFQNQALEFDRYGKYAYNFVWAGFYLSGRLLGNQKMVRTGRDILVANLSANVLGTILWFSLGRQRPEFSDNKHTLKMFDLDNLKATIPPFEIQPSFPSLHTVGIACIATVVTKHYGYWAGLPCFAFMGIVGYSRMALEGHYFSDVVGGAFLGILSGMITTEMLDKPVSSAKSQTLSLKPVLIDRNFCLNFRYSF